WNTVSACVGVQACAGAPLLRHAVKPSLRLVDAIPGSKRRSRAINSEPRGILLPAPPCTNLQSPTVSRPSAMPKKNRRHRDGGSVMPGAGSDAEYQEHEVVGQHAHNDDAGDIQLEAGGNHVADLHVASTEDD